MAYPRNTFNAMRDEEKYGKQYKQCGFVVRDSDVIHPYKDAATNITRYFIVYKAFFLII